MAEPVPDDGQVVVDAIGVNFRDVYEREGGGYGSYGSRRPRSWASRVPAPSPRRSGAVAREGGRAGVSPSAGDDGWHYIRIGVAKAPGLPFLCQLKDFC